MRRSLRQARCFYVRCERSFPFPQRLTCSHSYQLAIINAGVINEDCTNLISGQSYCIGYDAEDCSDVWVVEAQQTCGEITSATGLNQTLLQENNPQIAREMLQTGRSCVNQDLD